MSKSSNRCCAQLQPHRTSVNAHLKVLGKQLCLQHSRLSAPPLQTCRISSCSTIVYAAMVHQQLYLQLSESLPREVLEGNNSEDECGPVPDTDNHPDREKMNKLRELSRQPLLLRKRTTDGYTDGNDTKQGCPSRQGLRQNTHQSNSRWWRQLICQALRLARAFGVSGCGKQTESGSATSGFCCELSPAHQHSRRKISCEQAVAARETSAVVRGTCSCQ